MVRPTATAYGSPTRASRCYLGSMVHPLLYPGNAWLGFRCASARRRDRQPRGVSRQRNQPDPAAARDRRAAGDRKPAASASSTSTGYADSRLYRHALRDLRPAGLLPVCAASGVQHHPQNPTTTSVQHHSIAAPPAPRRPTPRGPTRTRRAGSGRGDEHRGVDAVDPAAVAGVSSCTGSVLRITTR
jgi:hypothetical protein